MMSLKGKIALCLWFDGQAEAAAAFYTSLFPDAGIDHITRYSTAGPGAPGSVMTVTFRLAGQEIVALNGGPEFPFTPACSLVVQCADQAELDDLWARLSAGGRESCCGWLVDAFGLSWQIVPAGLDDLVDVADPERAARVMSALLGMRKIDIAAVREAAVAQPT